MTLNMKVKDELEIIRGKHGGILRPVDVVEYARDPQTLLHQYFEWDDSVAGHQYRLQQARSVIRVVVSVVEGDKEEIRTYVSLRDDRNEGDSYRALVDVLQDEELTKKLLRDALTDLETFRKKYQRLKDMSQLSGVLEAIDEALKS